MRVDGIGPSPCEFFVVGEAPGMQDDRTGKPYSGSIGSELNRYLDGINLPARSEVFLTNIYRFYGGKDYVYTAEDLARDEPYLHAELQRVLPIIIVTLGRPATRYFLGDVDMDSVQGIPFYLPEEFEGYPCAPEGVVVVPLIHPMAGMHNSEMSPHVVAGFKALAAFLEGEIEPRKLFDDPYKEPHYEEITTEAQLVAALDGLQPGQPLAIDSEGWPGLDWSMQFSTQCGTGQLIKADDGELLRLFSESLRRVRPRIIFHSALHDLQTGRSMGVEFAGLEFDDTMVMAYLLQLEPQGLKQGSLRHCNMQMLHFDELVGDVSNELAREYLTAIYDIEQIRWVEACECEMVRLQTTPYLDKRGKLKPGRSIRKPPTLPKTQLHKAVSRAVQSKRPRTLWEDQLEDVQVAGYNVMGPLPVATLDYVDQRAAIEYACRDADATLRLEVEYRKRLEAMELVDVYNLELSTYPLLDRMQQIGIKPDLKHFAALSVKLEGEIVILRERLASLTGIDTFNANSGDQAAEYLFGTLGLEELKMTRSGRGSTNDKILEALEHEHPEYPVISDIRAYRELYKLKNTFVDRLPDFVHRWPFDGRVHTTLRTTRVVTGRLAASDPNLLAQPEHGKFAKDFQRGWVAGEGHVICAWDESQVELRGLAHLSRDPIMCGVFRGDIRNPDGSRIDLHAATAERIFGVKPKDQDSSKHRLPAKAINFGIPMGMTCKGLSVELRKNGVDADEDTAQRWLDETLGLYQGVRDYMAERIAEARRTGMVRCLSGRIRYIGGIHSRDERVREEAERFAFSTPIQESATFIMKQAEHVVYEDILVPYWKDGCWVEPLIQVHDCLKLECEEGMEQELHLLMTEAMTRVEKGFCVPLAVEGKFGHNMADMHRF